ncbi:LytTR family DNA-binding domain-containing protein [Kordiimonas sp.]|uniref:LytTR family DNA-binding domain-containing protein n=1 Tax=Kordiimonas sp. TaxID=1970157 RepID=UPI003B52C319
MKREDVNFWDAKPYVTAFIVVVGSASTSMAGAYVPSVEFGKLATFLFWVVLTVIAAIILFGLRFVFERNSRLAQLPFAGKMVMVWGAGLLIFSPFSELIDMAIGLSEYPVVEGQTYSTRTHFLMQGIWHEVLCAAVPMFYMALLLDMLWFSRGNCPETEHIMGGSHGANRAHKLNQMELEEISSQPSMPRFLLRSDLPDTAEILHIEAQQHYIMVTTESGNELIYYRFGDAIVDVAHMNGLQVHRSHWVAEGAVRRAVKKGRNIEITLFDGRTIPVSRNRQAAIQKAGWLEGSFTQTPISEVNVLSIDAASFS